MKLERICLRLTYASCVVLALGLFTSFSFLALGHIFLLLPGLYFCWQNFNNEKIETHLSLSALCLLVLVTVGIFSLLFNEVEDPLRKALKLKYFLFGVLGIYAYQKAFTYYIHEKKIRFLLNAVLISTTIGTLSGLIGLYTGWNPLRFKEACHPTRNCGAYGMYMTYGYGIQFFMVILTGFILYRKKVERYCNLKFLYTAFAINLLGLVLSYARGALIGFLVSLPFFFFKKRKKTFAMVFFILLMGGSILFMTNNKFKDLFLSSQRIESNMIRISQFKAAFYAFKERPFLGIGYRNFEPNVYALKKRYQIDYPQYMGHAHNNFLEALASTGIFGFTFLILFHLFWLRESYLRKDILGNIAFPLIIALIISGQFQYTIGDGENMFLLMMAYSLSQISLQRNEDDA